MENATPSRFQHSVKFKVNDDTYDLVWPRHDNETLTVIMNDWSVYLPKILAKLKSTRTVVQAGGHCGVYPLLYSKIFKHVFTFEPELTNFTHLAVNCTDTRITKLNAALSDRNELISMAIVSYINTGMNKVLPRGMHGLIAYGVTLDSIKPHDVDLIHLDVEGYEYQALKGAVRTIAKYKPLIVTEMSHNINKIQDLMKKLDYVEIEKIDSKSENSMFAHKDNI